MIKRYLGHILASSVLWTSVISQVYAEVDTQVDNSTIGSKLIQRSFLNLDFTSPNINTNYNGNGQRGTGATNVALPETLVSGWRTTHRSMSADTYWQAGRLIEIWRGQGAPSDKMTGETSTSTNQYAELNAEEESVLYQNICLIKDETFSYSFVHATRSNTNERAKFSIGTVTDTGTTVKRGWTAHQNIVSATSTTTNKTWKPYNGTATVTSIPLSSGIYSFGFEAISTGTVGNFLDKISITGLKPVVEFSTVSASVFENVTGVVPIKFKMVGNVTSTTMPTLKFKISYNSTVALENRAIYGVDYVLKKRIGATGTTFTELTTADVLNYNTNTGEVTFSYKPDYNSNLNYEYGVEFNGLVIELKDNKKSFGDKTLPLSFEPMSDVLLIGLETCSKTNIKSSFDFSIQEDDIDLAVVKTLTPESVIQKDSLVSYKLDVMNNSAIQVDGVLLRDNFQNLLKVTSGDAANQTSLLCEDLTSGTSKTCSATWTDANALTSLMPNTNTTGSGLSLGNIPANAKYRFTVKNLKVTDTDNTSAGYAVNTATVETTKMNDLDSTNNTSTVKTLLAAKNDLSNNITSAPTADAAVTGVGMFFIGKEGRTGTTPLWTQKAIANAKVYFPLNIQNYANLAQDYQLYASSTAVSPTLSSGDYSTLVKSGINPFSSGLKVEFFALGNAQCKVGTSGGQQITQLTVPANTTGEVCAVATLYGSANAKQDIWFAIESMQSGLGDVIRNAITSDHLQQRLLELLNDQTAQVNAGGTYVFSHRLLNRGVISEQNISFKLIPFTNDGFLYTLFEDVNKNGILDAVDRMISNQAFSIAASAELALLIKVQAPAIATNGMSSQVKLEAVPDNNGQSIILASLSNTDNIIVSSNQLHIQKMQYKQANCTAMDNSAVKNAVYSIQNVTLKLNDCLIYRITVKNIGDSELKNVSVNDMYPAYTIPWKPNAVLPMTSTGDNVQDDGAKVKTILPSLLPQAEKSLYFGIKMQ